MLRFKRSSFLIALILGLVILVYRHIFQLQPHAAGDLSFFFDSNLRELLFPYVWRNSPGFGGLGETTIPTLWIYPTFVIFAVVNLLTKLPMEIIFPILFGVVFICTAFLSMYSLALKFSLSKEGAALAGLFYLVNSYILLVVDGGQLGVAYGYSLFPFSFVSFTKIIDKGRFNWGLSLILFGVLSYLDLRVFLLSLFVCLIYSLFNLRKIWAFKRKFISWVILLSLFLVSIHFYWVIPLIGLKDQVVGQLPSLNDFRNLSFITLKDGYLLFQPHWPLNMFGKLSLPGLSFFLIPIISFLPLFFKKDRRVLAVFLISLVSIFMVKGSNPPLGAVNEWIFINIPGMQLFRDSSKFFIPIALCFSIFWGSTYDLIVDWLKHLNSMSFKINVSFAASSVFLILVLLIILPIRAILGQSLTGMLGNTVRDSAFEKSTNMIREDQSFFRTLWAPEKPVYGYSDTLRPALSPKTLSDIPAFQLLSQGRYDLFEFIRSPLSEHFLRLIGVKYLFFSPEFSLDSRKLSFLDYARNTTNFLRSLSWLSQRDDSSASIYQLRNPQDKFTSFNKLFLIDGSQDIYRYLYQIQPEFLTKNAFLFIDQLKPDVLDQLTSDYPREIFILSKSKEDLRLNTVNLQTPSNPSFSGGWGKVSDQSNQWVEMLKTRSVLQHNDREISEDVFFSTIPKETLRFVTSPNQETFVKLFLNRRGGSVKITTNTGEREINTKSFKDSFEWVSVGPVAEFLELQNIQGFNAVKNPLQMSSEISVLAEKLSNRGQNIYLEEKSSAHSTNTQAGFKQNLDIEEIQRRSKKKTIFKEHGLVESEDLDDSITCDGIAIEGDRVYSLAFNANSNPSSILVHFKTSNLERLADSVKVEKNSEGNLTGFIRTPWWATNLELEFVFNSLPTNLQIELQDEDSDLWKKALPESLTKTTLDSIPQTLSWQIVDPTHYRVHASDGKFLVFNEAYSSLWKVKTGDEILDTLPGYSFLNLFTNKDNLPIEVFIPEQNQVNKLLILAIVSWIGVIIVCMFYYFYEKKT